MNRRSFLVRSSAAAFGALVGCSSQYPDTNSGEPVTNRNQAFSRDALHRSLDRLLSAFELKGRPISSSLLEPVAESALREQCSWFPAHLPDELVALYGWRGGQRLGGWEEEFPFWFRDKAFSNLVTAERSYRQMMDSYGTFEQDREMLRNSFPFAEFNGGWLVLPCGPHHQQEHHRRPAYSIDEGVDVWFYSLSSMASTCADWVSHHEYSQEDMLPPSVELEIWRRHNPGIFPGAT